MTIKTNHVSPCGVAGLAMRAGTLQALGPGPGFNERAAQVTLHGVAAAARRGDADLPKTVEGLRDLGYRCRDHAPKHPSPRGEE